MLENEKLTNDDFDNIDRNFCLDKGRLTKSTFFTQLICSKTFKLNCNQLNQIHMKILFQAGNHRPMCIYNNNLSNDLCWNAHP